MKQTVFACIFVCLLSTVFSQEDMIAQTTYEIDSIKLTNSTIKKASELFLNLLDEVPQKDEIVLLCVSKLFDTLHIEMIETTNNKAMLLVSLSYGAFRKSHFVGKTVAHNRNIYVYQGKDSFKQPFYKEIDKCLIDSNIKWITIPVTFNYEDFFASGLHVDPWHVVFETKGNKLYYVEIDEVEWWILEDLKQKNENIDMLSPSTRTYYTLKEFKKKFMTIINKKE